MVMESPDVQGQQDTKPENLGDAIADTFDELEAAGEENGEEVEVSEEAAAEDTTQDAGEEASEEVAAEQEEEQEEVSEELQEEIEAAADSDYNEPAPERWPDEIREVYDSLPPVARKAMLEGVYKPMQANYTRATQELSHMRGQVQPMLEVMDQHRNDFERMGVEPSEVFRTQMAWAAHLSRVGVEQGLADMSAAYGVGTPKAGGQEGDVYLTPTERALKAQVDALQQQVTGQGENFQQLTARQQQEQEIAHRNEIQQNLTAFINEKTDDGKPKHPHVEKLASNIAGIIRGGLVAQADQYGQPVPLRNVIAQAYNMACNLDPAIRTPRSGQRQAKRVEAAQKTDVVTKIPAGQDATDVDELGMTDFISKTFDELDRRSA